MSWQANYSYQVYPAQKFLGCGQDEIGTPYCVTIDFDTLQDSGDHQTVTVRNRDDTTQDRVHINELLDYIK